MIKKKKEKEKYEFQNFCTVFSFGNTSV